MLVYVGGCTARYARLMFHMCLIAQATAFGSNSIGPLVSAVCQNTCSCHHLLSFSHRSWCEGEWLPLLSWLFLHNGRIRQSLTLGWAGGHLWLKAPTTHTLLLSWHPDQIRFFPRGTWLTQPFSQTDSRDVNTNGFACNWFAINSTKAKFKCNFQKQPFQDTAFLRQSFENFFKQSSNTPLETCKTFFSSHNLCSTSLLRQHPTAAQGTFLSKVFYVCPFLSCAVFLFHSVKQIMDFCTLCAMVAGYPASTVLFVEVSSLAGVWLKLWTWQGGNAPLMTAGATMPFKHMVANQKPKLMDFMAGIGRLHQSTWNLRSQHLSVWFCFSLSRWWCWLGMW